MAIWEKIQIDKEFKNKNLNWDQLILRQTSAYTGISEYKFIFVHVSTFQAGPKGHGHRGQNGFFGNIISRDIGNKTVFKEA